MKKAIFILSVLAGLCVTILAGQNIELSFTGDNNGQPVLLDSVLVKNINQGAEVMLYPPDLSLVLIITGINDKIEETNTKFRLSQNYPNPFQNKTSVQLHVPGTNLVKFVVSNLLGQNLLTSSKVIDAGIHTFLFTPGRETCYFLTASCEGQTNTIKMLCNPVGEGKSISLSHNEKMDYKPIMKSLEMLGELPFELGDELLMCAWSEMGESGMTKSPEMSQEYVMQFATNVLCPGLDSLFYGDQWYHTIQVGGQCWIKENMNVGEMINGNQTQTNNGTIEKYCYANSTILCDERGGFYKWNELMQYETEKRARGICPEGWHIPTDEEFKVLEGMVDSNYPIGHTEWNQQNWRGFDAANNLKSTSGWANNGNGIDQYGFCLLTTGYWWEGGFFDLTQGTTLYTSTQFNNSPWYRGFNAMTDEILRNQGTWNSATAVRCIKD